jgi:hypothetical protein
VAVDNALYGCQANSTSGKFALTVEALENTKKLVGVLHVESCAVIAHKVDGSPAFALDPEFNVGIKLFGSKLPGVTKQVFEYYP